MLPGLVYIFHQPGEGLLTTDEEIKTQDLTVFFFLRDFFDSKARQVIIEDYGKFPV